MMFPLHASRCDIAMLEWLHSHTIPYSVPLLQVISFSTTYISIFIALVILVVSVVKKSGSIRRKFFTIATVLILVAIVSQGMKAIIYRDRPFETYPLIEKLSEAGGSSFPSGHTLEAFAMAMALAILFTGKKIAVPAFIWAALVAYSRMALGVHYPTDVLAGVLLGIFIGWFIPWLYKRFNPEKNDVTRS